MSLNSDEVFGLAIDQSIKDWKSFQLCVDQGMGGQYTSEKLVWMTQTITEFFKSNRDLEVDEVMDFVAEIIDNEFDTIIEDGSLRLFSSNLSKFYHLCSSGRQQEVIDKLQDIRQQNKLLINDNSEQKDNQSVVENQMKSLNLNSDNDIEMDQTVEQTDPEDEGWTQVQRKQRK